MKPYPLFALLGFLTAVSAFSCQAAEIKKVLFVGDSITCHDPRAELGWNGHWGMAASAEGKDYVHLFLARLAQSQGGAQPKFVIAGGGGGKIADKLALHSEFTAFASDLAVIQLGENDNQDVSESGFQKPYEEIVKAIRAGNPRAQIFCFGVWAPPLGNGNKDGMIRKVCAANSAVFVSLAAANSDPLGKAGSENRFTHPGVNWHPGDRGMQGYADALWKAYSTPHTEPSATATSGAPASPAAWSDTKTWAADGGKKWYPALPVEEVDGRPVAVIRNDAPEGRVVSVTKLPVDQCAGRTLTIKTRVKAEGISPKVNRWNGIKIMLRLENAEGVPNFPQVDLPTGTFDWKDVNWSVNVPDNTVGTYLMIGLENVSGTLWVDPIEIQALPR